MKTLLLIGSGGFLGSVLRYLISQYIQLRYLADFPYGTFVVNVAGCFIIGTLFGFSEKGVLSDEWRMFLATGICGGFTTFSAFSNETMVLMRDGQVFIALVYVAASISIGLAATFAGMAAARMF